MQHYSQQRRSPRQRSPKCRNRQQHSPKEHKHSLKDGSDSVRHATLPWQGRLNPQLISSLSPKLISDINRLWYSLLSKCQANTIFTFLLTSSIQIMSIATCTWTFEVGHW
jgi:hypothetical protein